jgi:hypothetical protein
MVPIVIPNAQQNVIKPIYKIGISNRLTNEFFLPKKFAPAT